MDGVAERGGAGVEPGEEIDGLAHRVIGAAIEVHRILGPGYLESAYGRALEIEFGLLGIAFQRQVRIEMSYKGHSVGEVRLDFLVGNHLVVELKAVESILPLHRAQLVSYLKATGHQLGLLINFNAFPLKNGIHRIISS